MHYRMQPKEHEGARRLDWSYVAALVEQSPAVSGCVERDDPAKEAVGQRQPHHIGEQVGRRKRHAHMRTVQISRDARGGSGTPCVRG